MKKKKVKLLFVKRIEWGNPNTSPPDGRPRLLAEIVVEHQTDGKKELEKHFPGCGSGCSITFRALPPPLRVTPPEVLAERRRKALAKKMENRFPLFAQEFTDDRIKQRPDYYIDGRGHNEEERAEILRQEAAYYEEASRRIGVLVVFDKANEQAG